MYRMIYKGFLDDLAGALAEGVEKWNEGEHDRNWQKGDEKFFREAFDHLIGHLQTYNETGNRYHNGEDHLAHAAANLMFLMWAEDFHKIMWPGLEAEMPPASAQWPKDDPRMTDTSDVSVGSYGLGAHDYLVGKNDHSEELEREQIIELEQKIRDMESAIQDSGGWFKKLIKKG